METVKKVAVEKAVRLLSGAGAKFKIIDEEGNEYGVLEVVERQRKRHKKTGLHFIDYYRDKVKEMKPGEVVKIDCPNGITAYDMRGSLSAYAGKLFGAGNYITHVHRTPDGREYVECLRVV